MNRYLADPPTQVRKRGDRLLLKSLENPTAQPHEIRVHCPEVTFLGKREQPDFACVDVTMYPADRVIELKSLKRYSFSFREVLMSYERFLNVVYDDLTATNRPARLIVEMDVRPRGGIRSRLKIDSAWRTPNAEPGGIPPHSVARAT